jgi:hypothetical protein
MQALLAFLLLAAAVPLGMRWLPLPDLSGIAADLAGPLPGLASSLLREWNALVAGFSRLLSLPGSLPDLPLSSVPAAGLVVTLIAAGFLWLVGNGVLLRVTSSAERG